MTVIAFVNQMPDSDNRFAATMMNDDFFWGLGYHPSSGSQQPQQYREPTDQYRVRSNANQALQQPSPQQQQQQQQDDATCNNSAVDSLMAHYLQQCLDYHNLQLQQDQNPQQQQQMHGDDFHQQQQQQQEDQQPHFVPAHQLPLQHEHPPLPSRPDSQSALNAFPPGLPTNIYVHEPHIASSLNDNTMITSTTSSTTSGYTPPVEIVTTAVEKSEPESHPTIEQISTTIKSEAPAIATDIETAAMQARAKAMAVIQSFSKPQVTIDATGRQQLQPSLVYGLNAVVTATTSDCLIKRQQCLEREQQRKEKALLKNFAFVAVREEQRLIQRLADIEQTKQREIDLAKHHATLLEERTKRLHQLRTGKATFGIGTEQRQKLDKKQHRSQQQQQQQQQRRGGGGEQDPSASVAIYVSGLSDDITDETLRPWFGAYAKLRKIHIYRDKDSGKAKGDALVIYQIPCDQDALELIQTVCQQMNGAELPDGSVLQVEPAESNQSVKKDTNMSMLYGVNTTQSKGGSRAEENEVVKDLVNPTDQAPPATKSEEGNDENDLDDFFASLS